MSEKNQNTKDQIISATIGLLLKNTPESLTVRQIAEKAGVNVAAVNYHFGSKDSLIKTAAEKATADGFPHLMKILDMDEIPPVERLEKFLLSYLEVCIDYPNFSKTQINEGYFKPLEQGPLLERGKIMFDETKRFLKAHFPGLEAADYDRIIMHLHSAILYPFLFKDFFVRTLDQDIDNPEQRKNYVHHVISSFHAFLKERDAGSEQ